MSGGFYSVNLFTHLLATGTLQSPGNAFQPETYFNLCVLLGMNDLSESSAESSVEKNREAHVIEIWPHADLTHKGDGTSGLAECCAGSYYRA